MEKSAEEFITGILMLAAVADFSPVDLLSRTSSFELDSIKNLQ
jgi:hypothetical protein